MAHALEDAGLTDAIDVIYGTSAYGTFAGAYIGAALLGHGRGVAEICYEGMPAPRSRV